MGIKLNKYVFKPTAGTVRMLGRTTLVDDSILLGLSGTGIEFYYKGTGLSVTFLGDSTTEVDENLPQPYNDQARVGVIVDGRMHLDVVLTKPKQTYEICSFDENQEVAEHIVRIVKLSEARMSTCAIGEIVICAEEIAKPTKTPEKMIEFIGDSITCGFGVDAPDEGYNFSTTTENATKAFAYLAAKELGMDYSLVSYSGHGLLSGYTDNSEIMNSEELVQPYYDLLAHSYNSFRQKRVQDITWKFDKKPDFIVINLGTNDESYVAKDLEKTKEFENKYLEFLKKVHEINPNATIICAYGVMEEYLFETQVSSVERFKKETLFDSIYNLKLSRQNSEINGYGACWHPSHRTQIEAAKELSLFIKSIM